MTFRMTSLAKFVSPARCVTSRLWKSADREWKRCVHTFSQSCQKSDTDDHRCPGFDQYKDLVGYFKRRLKATYHRFSDSSDCSLVYGRDHVYSIESDGIYRRNKRQTGVPDQVLDLTQFDGWEEKTKSGRRKRRQTSQWSVQRVRVSPLESHLAATLTTAQQEEQRCVVVRLREKNPIPPKIVQTLDKVFSFEWATENVLFFTTVEDLCSIEVHRLNLNSNRNTFTSVYKATCPDVFVEVSLSRDRQILTINCSSRTSSEVLVVVQAAVTLEPLLVQRRQPDLLYHVEHWRNWLIILANTGPGLEYQVLRAPLSNCSMASWDPVFTPSHGTVITDMDVVGDHCVLVTKTPANQLELVVVSLTQPGQAYTLQLPSWVCAIETRHPGFTENHRVLEFLISSPVHPPELYSLDPKQGRLLSGTAQEKHRSFIVTRSEARSQDGTLIPVTLLHSGPLESLKKAPLLVHVYGAYGRDLTMQFCPERRLLMELGWTLAYCHIRGGGERGLSWQRQARMIHKHKGIEDLQACLLYIFSSGVSSSANTVLTAYSAGAVPVGALCNRHPHLVKAVTLQSPFLDVLGTMEDPDLPLTIEDREEWGDPLKNPQHRQAILSYCPLHNIAPQCYPSMLVTAFRGDTRVPLAGVLKYTQRIKEAVDTHFSRQPPAENTPQPSVLLKVRPGESHVRAGDLECKMQEEVLELAFIYKELRLNPPSAARRRKRPEADPR
ncbi:prolyl endopeptidase-like isoform 1-T1 [Synchiropus picturatus]